jgi:EmrB/QacA subfamily drug resistance transporter
VQIRQHHNVTLAVLTLAGTAYSLQQTMVVPALRVIQRDLHTTTTWVTWVLTVFMLVSSVATPILGKLGDQHGKERLLAISLLVFLAGCVGCIFAWNVWSLIAFRALSGTGGAVFPLAIGIVRDEFPEEKIGVGLGLISAVFGVGGGLGIVLSGVLTDNVGWRWIFVVGSLVTLAALVLVHRFVPESPVKSPSRIDVPGAVLLSAGLSALLLALTEGENWGWGSARIAGLFIGALVTLIVWIRVELRVPEPLVDMRVLRGRTVLLTNLATAIAGFSMFSVFVLVPLYAQTPRGLAESTARLVHYGFGNSTTISGLYLLPSSLLVLVGGPLGGMLGRRIGMKWVLSLGLVLVALSSAALVTWHDRPWHLVVSQVPFGIGVGFAFASTATLITAAVTAAETGVANGINTVMRTIGGVLGAQVGAAVLTAHTIGRTRVPTVGAYETVFGASAVVALVGAVLAVWVTPTGLRARREAALSRAPAR